MKTAGVLELGLIRNQAGARRNIRLRYRCFLVQPAGSHPEPVGQEVGVIDFKRRNLPHFLVQTDGLSGAENWGRWSDANLSEAVTLRFFDPLPKKFRMELTCVASGANADRPVRVEIGDNVKFFSPTAAVATYEIDFALDRAERTIKLYPSRPTSPASLDTSSSDRRRLGIGLCRTYPHLGCTLGMGVQRSRVCRYAQPGTDRQEIAYWQSFYSKEDPWGYRAPYEQGKYGQTLELLPQDPDPTRTRDLICAEGLFTEMLAPRVGRLLGFWIFPSLLCPARESDADALLMFPFNASDINGAIP